MTRPRLLDLFCGAGGAGMGYHNAGFDVTGIDIKPQPRYPFKFTQANALEYLESYAHKYDAIHASPPCQRFSDLAHRNGNSHEHPDLIDPLRMLLICTNKPYVIENVEGAPLLNPTWLCGCTFITLAVLRKRGFESNFGIPPKLCLKKHPLVYTRDKRKSHYGKLNQYTSFVSVNGGGNCSVTRAKQAMGISWMTKAELNEAIPPAYTEYIGHHLMRVLTGGSTS